MSRSVIHHRRATQRRAPAVVSRSARPRSLTPPEEHAFEQAYNAGWFERVGHKVEPSPMAKRWAQG